jgi:NEDD8-activating enzyme E1
LSSLETPRLPEHCITYAYLIEWERTFGDRKLDADNPNDMQWVYHKALERAEQYGIAGVTYFLTIGTDNWLLSLPTHTLTSSRTLSSAGVVKNVIPAVASTNAIISAACVNETLKLLTYTSQTMNTYFMYMGNDGIYTSTFEYKINTECAVCSSSSPRVLTMPRTTTTFADFLQLLAEDPLLQIKNPFITCRDRPVTLFATSPPQLAQLTSENLVKVMSELVEEGEYLIVTDKGLRHEVTVQIVFKD